MEIKIYIDVLFVINLIFNYLLLWLAGLILSKPAKFLRTFGAACFGGLYSLCVFFLPNLPFYGLLGKLAVGTIMSALVFRPKSMRAFIQYICVFHAVVFIYGGLAFAFFYFTDAASLLGAVYRNGTLYINLPVSLLLGLSLVCYLLFKMVIRLGSHFSAVRQNIIPLCVAYKGKRLFLRGFHDSGNLLRDEAGGKGVIVTEWRLAKTLFSQKSLDEVLQTETDLSLLPYQTLQGKSVLPAFLPDALYIKQGKDLIETEPVYIGLSEQSLDRYHNWDAILPHDFKGVTQNETAADSKTKAVCQRKKKPNSLLALRNR